ncbi:hypothetical protein ANCDUO_19978, partial [Ancylostoma duodenale]
MRDDSAGPFAAALDRQESVSPVPPDPHIQRLWNESLDINDMAIMEQNDMTQLRTMLGIERISAETLSRYNVRGHVDKFDQAAILYPKLGYKYGRATNVLALASSRLCSNDGPCSNVASTSKDERARSLAQVIASAEGSVRHVPLTRSQLAEELSKEGIPFERVTHGNFLRVNCVFCDAERSCYISGLDNSVTCVVCHESQPFNVFLMTAASKKLKAKPEDDVKQKERPQTEELLRLMENPEEVDPDLYDR